MRAIRIVTFPAVCDRILNRDESVPLTFVAFDLLALDGEESMSLPYSERRQLLDSLGLCNEGCHVSQSSATRSRSGMSSSSASTRGSSRSA